MECGESQAFEDVWGRSVNPEAVTGWPLRPCGAGFQCAEKRPLLPPSELAPYPTHLPTSLLNVGYFGDRITGPACTAELLTSTGGQVDENPWPCVPGDKRNTSFLSAFKSRCPTGGRVRQ